MGLEAFQINSTISESGWDTYDITKVTSDDSVFLDPSSNTSSPELRAGFPTPSGDLTTGSGAQSFQVYARRFEQTQTGTPTLRIELWEAGGGSALATSSELNLVHDELIFTFFWDASLLSDISGADVEVKIVITKATGSPSERASGSVDYIVWKVTYNDPPEEYYSSSSASSSQISSSLASSSCSPPDVICISRCDYDSNSEGTYVFDGTSVYTFTNTTTGDTYEFSWDDPSFNVWSHFNITQGSEISDNVGDNFCDPTETETAYTITEGACEVSSSSSSASSASSSSLESVISSPSSVSSSSAPYTPSGSSSASSSVSSSSRPYIPPGSSSSISSSASSSVESFGSSKSMSSVSESSSASSSNSSSSNQE